MKTTELRLRNLVQPNEGHKAAYGENNIAFVTEIDEAGFTVCYHYPGKWFEPIPLTEEWLVKFGFDIKKSPNYECWWEIYKGNFYMQKIQGDDYWSTRIEIDHDESNKLGHIIYVHQLQNLYFALTGKELTLQS